MKRCSVCKTEKVESDFYTDRRATDGLKSACKACHMAQGKLWAQRNKNKVEAKTQRWRDRNRAKFLESMRKSHRKNSKKNYQTHLAWRRKNPERWRDLLRAGQRNYKARKRAAEGRHTADDIRNLYQLQKGRCAVCKVSLKPGYHVDHVVALASGGTNWPDNLQLLCPPCNVSKKDRDPIAFMQERGMLL